MDARKERGRALAQRGKIVKLAQGWRVPSSSGSGSYFVRLAKKPSCTCPDFEYWQLPCKHIYAVEYLITWDTTTDDTQTFTTKTEKVRITYKQNWPASRAALLAFLPDTYFQDRVSIILKLGLCGFHVLQPPASEKGVGR